MIKKLKIWAKSLKRQVFILYLATRDKRTPWVAKVIAVCVVAYAFSPIDLIPDFIPILGYLDDVIIVPLGIMLAIKLIPEPIISDCKVKVCRKTYRHWSYIQSAVTMTLITSLNCLFSPWIGLLFTGNRYVIQLLFVVLMIDKMHCEPFSLLGIEKNKAYMVCVYMDCTFKSLFD